MYREGPTYQRRGSLQLWQFLVALLDDPSNSHFIAWTGRGMEFKLIEPEEVGLTDFCLENQICYNIEETYIRSVCQKRFCLFVCLFVFTFKTLGKPSKLEGGQRKKMYPFKLRNEYVAHFFQLNTILWN